LSDEDTSRAGFIEHPLWVTAYARDERFAAGDTPNQNPGRPGLPQYVEDITDTDIVLWHTVGFHHVPSAEKENPEDRSPYALSCRKFLRLLACSPGGSHLFARIL